MLSVLNMYAPIKTRFEGGVVYSPFPPCDIRKCSFYALASERLQNSPEKLILVDDSRALTRAECLIQMQRYAAGFQAHGVQPGDHVCVHFANSIDNYVAMYGCIFAGAVLVPAKTSLTEKELHYQVKDADVVHILTEQKFAQKVRNVHAVAPLKGLFVMGDAEGFVSASKFSHLKESEFQEIPVPDPERTLMALAYTSGTTGLPKAAEITHFNYVASFYTSAPLLTATEADVTLLWNPITHASGLWSILTALIGATYVVAPHTLSMEGYADLMDRFKVTALSCFPTRLQNLVQYARSADRRLNTLLHIAVGGSMLSEQLAELSLSTFGNLRSLRYLYGMTESNGVICVPPRDVVCYTDVGYPSAMVEIKIVNPTSGEALKPNEIGELYFRTPTASRGYYKRPLATAEFRDREGWCRSGDLAYYDTDGRIYFVERMKEVIKCLENQVVPAELEELLLANHDGIAEVAVVGLPHSVYGEAPAAVVVPKKDIGNGGPAMEREIKEVIADTIAAYTLTNTFLGAAMYILSIKRISSNSNTEDRFYTLSEGTCARHKHLYGGVFFVESLPRTETGKVQRKALVNTFTSRVRD